VDSDGPNWLLIGGGAVVAALFFGFWAGSKGPEHVSSSGFDLSSVSASARPAVPGAREEVRSSPAPVIGGVAEAPAVGIAGRPTPSASQAEGGARAPAAAADAAPEPLEGRERERAFLARHGAALKRYHARMAGIALRYRKTHKAVAEVDMAFAAMPRYMEVKKRFDRERDPFAFARDALALPEVRAEVSKRLKEPAVWSAALGMITATLKEAPPPKEFYDEALSFMTGDPDVSGHVERFTSEAASQAPAMASALPKDPAELAALQKLVADGNAAMAQKR
jgi:hypothetical protein